MRLAISCLVASRMVESKSTTSKVNCALAHASPEKSAHSIFIRTVSSYPTPPKPSEISEKNCST